ncbi:MAG: hypothetical protein KDI38_06080 [Calditrichaeota bacterium]|nr:hypothetical protein [Calditrichota bacterium]MCB9086902.1 hypothetical protein [Calditrichia bacterium]
MEKLPRKQQQIFERLDAFRLLTSIYPDEPAVRKQYADMLHKAYCAFDDVKFRYVLEPEQRAQILQTFSGFAEKHSQDNLLQARLLETLAEAVAHETDLRGLKLLIRTAHSVMQRGGKNLRVRKMYTGVLAATFSSPALKAHRQAHFKLLDELRSFAEAHFIDEFTWNEFARQLANVTIDERFKDNLIQRDKMLIELRVLSDRYPAYRKVRASLAFALAHADREENLMRRDAMIHELMTLVKKNPQDDEIFEHFLKTLSTTIQKELSINRQDMILDIFRDLVQRHAELRPREVFGFALIYAIGDAEKKGLRRRRDRLLEEFRLLEKKHPYHIRLKEMIQHSGLEPARFHFLQEPAPEAVEKKE